MGELGTIGEAAKGIGEGIEHAANGAERLLARIQDMASGPLATRRTKKLALAAKEAARGAVDVAKTAGAELSDHDRRAIAFDAMRSIQGFTNIEETVRMARLPGDADLGAIDDEWLSAFVNGAKEAFSDWKREVFAHTVESKVFDPSGVSIRALHAISRMEREDIRRFEAVCGLRPEIDGERGDPIDREPRPRRAQAGWPRPRRYHGPLRHRGPEKVVRAEAQSGHTHGPPIPRNRTLRPIRDACVLKSLLGITRCSFFRAAQSRFHA